MTIGAYNIQPISIYLPDDSDWKRRDDKAREYFYSVGIHDIEWVAGIHGHKWGIQGRHIYLLDSRPEEQFYIGDKKVAGFLTQYVVYNVMKRMSAEHFMFLETDCRFEPDWISVVEDALKDVPEDFDFLFVGSCCAADKEQIHVKGNVYHYPYRGEEKWTYYPQCGHCYIVAKKCMDVLIETQRDTATPADISLVRYAFPKLDIYAILPSPCYQDGTKLPA